MDEDELPNEDDQTPTWMNISEGQTVREGQQHRSILACNFSQLPQLSQEPSTSSTDGELPASLAPWSASPPSRQPAPCTPHPPSRQPPPCTPCRPSRPRPILGRGVTASDKNNNADQGDTNIKTGHGEPNIETDHQRSDQIVQNLHEILTILGVNRQYLFAPGLSNTLPVDHDDSNCSYLGGFDPSDKGFVSVVLKPDGSEGPLHPDQDHQQPFMPFQKEHLIKTCNNNNSRPVGWKGSHDPWSQGPAVYNEVNNLDVNVSKSEFVDSSSRMTLKGMKESRNIAPVESESSHTIRNLDVNVFKSEHAGNSDTMTGVGIGGESNQTNRNLYEWNSDLESAERTDNKMGAGTSNLTELDVDVDVSNLEHADSSDVMTGVGTGGKSTSTKENLDEQSLNLEPADSTDSKIGVG
ncbi:uncharacterized protein LOC121370244 [Gigantopelta aegis]|uniref:uncharacterized protein LOC121370244 n=1 Tax=Gigantopelta aegis TaxID=1735272 RepID=UPI001B88CD9E|nr:uncharacterized protein LOC121370244 [Gigantopelta aegis]